MKSITQKLLSLLSMVSVACLLFIHSAQASTYNQQMQLGLISATSAGTEVVIYNEDYSKCLSVLNKTINSTKSLTYAECRSDDRVTWQITKSGKILNKHSGKCLSTLKGEEQLIQANCGFVYTRDFQPRELIIVSDFSANKGSEVAAQRY